MARRCECQVERLRRLVLDRVDHRFRACALDTYEPKNSRQKRALEVMRANPFGSYFLWGNYRRGKTHLMVAQFKLVAPAKPAELRTSRDLMQEFRQAEIDDAYSSSVLMKADRLDEFHLFWDDLDKIKSSPFRDEMIFNLIDRLYRKRLGLTVTSNLDLQGLLDANAILPAVARRIDDLCEVFQL